jgi:hypothetical protein
MQAACILSGSWSFNGPRMPESPPGGSTTLTTTTFGRSGSRSNPAERQRPSQKRSSRLSEPAWLASRYDVTEKILLAVQADKVADLNRQIADLDGGVSSGAKLTENQRFEWFRPPAGYTSNPIARISASALLCWTTPGRMR